MSTISEILSNPKLHIEKIDGVSFNIRLFGRLDEQRAAFTHYLHDQGEGIASFYRQDAVARIQNTCF
tara:strand:- start:326 stop:526 length:201 start_codon:yes stop_codon:yes gene_type:complete